MGDTNAKTGKTGGVAGPFALQERNERGDKRLEWCSTEGQVATNSFFQHHPRRLGAWKSPGG